MATIRFYFDEMMSRIVANRLIEDGYVVVLAVDVGMVDKDDDTDHLPYAHNNNYVMVTQDRPFAGRTAKITDHSGLICWMGGQTDFGGQIRALQDFADNNEPDEVAGHVFWLS